MAFKWRSNGVHMAPVEVGFIFVEAASVYTRYAEDKRDIYIPRREGEGIEVHGHYYYIWT